MIKPREFFESNLNNGFVYVYANTKNYPGLNDTTCLLFQDEATVIVNDSGIEIIHPFTPGEFVSIPWGLIYKMTGEGDLLWPKEPVKLSVLNNSEISSYTEPKTGHLRIVKK